MSPEHQQPRKDKPPGAQPKRTESNTFLPPRQSYFMSQFSMLLKSLYGTNSQMETEEARAEAEEAILRMKGEAETLIKVTDPNNRAKEPFERIEEALRAIAEDL